MTKKKSLLEKHQLINIKLLWEKNLQLKKIYIIKKSSFIQQFFQSGKNNKFNKFFFIKKNNHASLKKYSYLHDN